MDDTRPVNAGTAPRSTPGIDASSGPGVGPRTGPGPDSHVDPRVDRSRGAVYQAEDVVAKVRSRPHRAVRIGRRLVELPAETRLQSLEDVQAFVDRVLADPQTRARHPGAGPVRVVAKRGFRSASYSAGVIHIPVVDPRGRWALTHAVVLHEVAHHLSPEPGHGAAFRAALVQLYQRQISPGAADLLAHLFAPLEDLPDLAAHRPAGADGQLRRVAALLAKASATTSPDEAEAYLAKAALVAQKHSIDLAVAALGSQRHEEAPTHRMLTIGEPRRALNTLLVSLYVAIARAWPVRVDIGSGSTYVVAYGMPADLDQVESIFVTASTMMATRSHAHVQSGAWKGTTYRPGDGGPARPVTSSVARNAFCLGFIDRLGGKLRQAADRARATPAPAAGSRTDQRTGQTTDRTALALRAREIEVADYHRQASRARGAWRGSASAAGSAAASRRAGERAADEYGRGSLPGSRRALGS